MALSRILANTDFEEPYNLFYRHSTNDGYQKYFEQIQDKCQKDFLIAILGHPMYEQLVDNYTSEADVFWDRLIDGYEYTYNGVTYNYLGVKDALIRYTYFHWHEYNKNRLQSAGAVRQGYEKSQKVMPADRMYTGWREMLSLINGDLQYQPTIYHFIDTQYTGDDWYYVGFEENNAWGI